MGRHPKDYEFKHALPWILLIIAIIIGFFVFMETWKGNKDVLNESAKTETIKTKITEKKIAEDTEIYSISVKIPNIENLDNLNAQEELNRAIRARVLAMMDSFKSDQGEQSQSIKASGEKSSLEINYEKVYLSDSFFSAKINIFQYTSGAAHPYSFVMTLNADLKNAKLLELSDMFEGPYLQFLSKKSLENLQQTFSSDDWQAIENMAQEGASPLAENFANIAFEKDKAIIYFSPYQVAPYVFGTVSSTFSYNDLSPYLKPNFKSLLQ